jgi:omega-amidase
MSMKPLTLTLIQGATRWHDAAANRAYYGELVRRHASGSDLCVLPETFLSGFTNDTLGQAEGMDGQGVTWMRALAAEVGCTLTGSLVIREGDACYNRMLWVQPDGHVVHYDKRHLFRMAREHERYAAGDRRRVMELNGWRICPQVCYDLRFPVWTRNAHREDAAAGMDFDLLLFVANWPAPRRGAWRTLLRARAIENLCYCAGVNRVGVDGNDLPYAGDSAVVDPLGEALVDLGSQPQAVSVTLDPQALLTHRQRFPAWMDADRFELLPGAGR